MLTQAQQKREQDKINRAIIFWTEIRENNLLKCRVCAKILVLKDNFAPCLKKEKLTGYLSYNRECKSCRNIRNINDRKFVRTSLNDVLKDRLYATTIRANKKNLELDIDLQFLLNLWNIQEGKCFYTKKPLSLKINDTDKVSIDRLDSSNGYTKNNVVLCRNCINYMKNDLSLNEFKNLISEIYENFK